MLNREELLKKWKPILEHEDLPKIDGSHKKFVTAKVLENMVVEGRKTGDFGSLRGILTEADAVGPTNSFAGGPSGTGNIDTFDPVLISLVRRSMPNLVAYDICGVQPMTGPTGLIFAMRSRYANQDGTETFFNEVNTAWSSKVGSANTLGDKHVGTLPGNTTQTINLAETGLYNYAGAMSTANAEALGGNTTYTFAEMSMSIEKVTVTAGTRALKAEYSLELAQDLKAIHGLDAEAELSNILSTEILAEINREVVRTIAVTAKRGASSGTTTAGIFDLDTDANGRWSVEKFKGLLFQIEREANALAKDTRRGRGNIILCSSDVASALQMAGVLDYTPALAQNGALQPDDTGNTFVGILAGKYKVYIDPYVSGGDYLVVGYKGPSPFDAGIFYCPYVPLQLVRAVDPERFTPKIGFKTRYGIIANPFAEGTTAGLGVLRKDSNVYYRRVIVTNLL